MEKILNLEKIEIRIEFSKAEIKFLFTIISPMPTLVHGTEEPCAFIAQATDSPFPEITNTKISLV